MRVIDNLIQYMNYKHLNDNEVTSQCGLAIGVIGKAKAGRNDIGKKTIEKILATYPDLSRTWLLTGEGSMLLGDVSGNNNAIGHGASVTHSDCCNIVDKFLGELAEQRKLVSESQRQVDRLLSIIEKMTNNI